MFSAPRLEIENRPGPVHAAPLGRAKQKASRNQLLRKAL